MNRRAQFTFIPWLLMLGVFIAFWAVALAPVINDVTQEQITAQGMTGLEAFFLGGLNIWILFSLILGVVVVIYFGVAM